LADKEHDSAAFKANPKQRASSALFGTGLVSVALLAVGGIGHLIHTQRQEQVQHLFTSTATYPVCEDLGNKLLAETKEVNRLSRKLIDFHQAVDKGTLDLYAATPDIMETAIAVNMASEKVQAAQAEIEQTFICRDLPNYSKANQLEREAKLANRNGARLSEYTNKMSRR
jgi:hypothetical protein